MENRISSLEPTVTAMVKNYGRTGNDYVFTDIFNLIAPVLFGRVPKLAARYQLDEQDVESEINKKVQDVIENYDESKGPFFRQLFTAIKYGCCDLCRSKNKDKKMWGGSLDDENFSDKLAPTSETTAEEDAITKIQKECEQRQLLANLIDNVDADTRQSISAYLDGGSYGKAAKLISVDKKTIQRRIKRLARKFDANQMGQITDYFTVPTVKVI
jgi:RNA polymerase sigma factor (sigma-70 family)